MGRSAANRKKRKVAARSNEKSPRQPIDRSFAIAIWASALALWAAFPPLDLGWLAWVAPAGWVFVADSRAPISRRGWLAIWFSGVAFWLATLQGIRLAYWPLYFGWIAMSLALGGYTPFFVWMTRRLTSRYLLPLFVAAPVAWVAVEFTRSWVLTGYCGNGLSHTQVAFPAVIQIADQLGGYGVSFLVMLVCAAIVQSVVALRGSQSVLRIAMPIVISVLAVGANYGYGRWRLAQADVLAEQSPLLTVLLVQENTPTMFDGSAEDLREAWTRYLNTTRELSRQHETADLVVWPESTFGGGVPYFAANRPTVMPDRLPFLTSDQVKENVEQFDVDFRTRVLYTLRATRGETVLGAIGGASQRPDASHLLVGSGAVEITPEEDKKFNSALFISPDGEVIGRYDKMHAVMFGEYIPLGALLKPLRDMYPISIFTGEEPQAFELAGTTICPNICFESMMPRLVSRQVRGLVSSGQSPDLIVNMSNDSWFRGSSMLDHHLACTILAAVENRRPVVVAANTGLSASIDGSGRVIQRTQRLEAAGILARPTADARPGLVQSLGYPLAWISALLCLLTFARKPKSPAVSGGASVT
ncbi:MAG: apolipoprotein N-acyltransferase [Aureliella sp.]